MLSAFAELPLIALDNTSKIAEQCELSLENNKIFLSKDISIENPKTKELLELLKTERDLLDQVLS